MLATPVMALKTVDEPVTLNLRFVVGNDVWQPGKAYSSSGNWLALACTSDQCALTPARLKVSKRSWQGHYDETATKGQLLSFALDSEQKGKIVAWLQTDSRLPWLQPRAVPVYPQQVAAEPGTLETQVQLPGGGLALLVPLLEGAKRTHDSEYGTGEHLLGGAFRLQLRTSGKRQMLQGELGACSHSISGDYLLWAGDLDGDGNADYLVSFIDADGPVHLYLSSAALADELAGFAGSYMSSPFGGECDGAGWF